MKYCAFCDPSVIEKQGIYKNDSIVGIYPQKPIIIRHFIIFPKRHVHLVSDLTNKESIDLKNAIAKIFTAYKEQEKCVGYNLSSNNGSEKVGQTVAHAHVHLYLRFEDEKYSPYKIMADSSLRKNLSAKQWQQQEEQCSILLNS